jgi:phage terminase small subunit
MTANRKLPPAPKHLEKIERDLWKCIVAENLFDGTASQSLLRVALESHQRMRRCRQAIDRDGEAVRDRWQQLKPHPLLSAERDARAAFLAAFRQLNLDLVEDPR